MISSIPNSVSKFFKGIIEFESTNTNFCATNYRTWMLKILETSLLQKAVLFSVPISVTNFCSLSLPYFSCYSRLKLTHIQSSVVFAFVLPTSASTGRSSAPQAFSKVNQLYVSFCRCLSLLDTYTLLEVSILWWAQEALLFCILSFSHCSSGTIFLTFSVSWAERPL